MTHHSHLRAIALAAQDVPLHTGRRRAQFIAACSPSAVLALLDELERVKAGLREMAALAMAGAHDDAGVIDHADIAQIAALRPLAGEP